MERFFRGISLKENKEDRDGEEKGQEEEVGEKNDEGMDEKEE